MAIRATKIENQLKKTVIQYLNNIGHFAYNTPNYPVWDEKLKMYRKHHGIKGMPDVHVCLKGGGYAVIETKGTGFQSDFQKAFEASVKRLGGIYVLAFTIDDVMKAFPVQGGYSGSLGL